VLKDGDLSVPVIDPISIFVFEIMDILIWTSLIAFRKKDILEKDA
jgi:hypothetical protein